jgi:hypothetical protein
MSSTHDAVLMKNDVFRAMPVVGVAYITPWAGPLFVVIEIDAADALYILFGVSRVPYETAR